MLSSIRVAVVMVSLSNKNPNYDNYLDYNATKHHLPCVPRISLSSWSPFSKFLGQMALMFSKAQYLHGADIFSIYYRILQKLQ